MQRAQMLRAITLLDWLYYRPDEQFTRTELCRRISLKRSPYALEIIRYLVTCGLLMYGDTVSVHGLPTQTLYLPVEQQGAALLKIDHLWEQINEQDEQKWRERHESA